MQVQGTKSFLPGRAVRKPQDQNGFTLIELMMVVFIMGILAAIAIPVYLGFTTRAKVGEGLSMGSALQRDVVLHHTMLGDFPSSNVEAGASAPDSYRGKYVNRMEIGPGGKITISYDDPALPGGTLELTPRSVDREVSWTCSSTTISPSVLPRTCRP